MVNMTNFFVPLAKKTDFNVSVKHIQSVIEILEDCDPKENIADKINLMIREQTIKPEQVRSILSVSLLDKWNYRVVSENLFWMTPPLLLLRLPNGPVLIWFSAMIIRIWVLSL